MIDENIGTLKGALRGVVHRGLGERKGTGESMGDDDFTVMVRRKKLNYCLRKRLKTVHDGFQNEGGAESKPRGPVRSWLT